MYVQLAYVCESSFKTRLHNAPDFITSKRSGCSPPTPVGLSQHDGPSRPVTAVHISTTSTGGGGTVVQLYVGPSQVPALLILRLKKSYGCPDVLHNKYTYCLKTFYQDC